MGDLGDVGPEPSTNTEEENALLDMNHTDAQMIGFRIHENQQENVSMINGLRPREQDLGVQALPASEFNYNAVVPSDGLVPTTQIMSVGGTPMLCHGVQSAHDEMHHGNMHMFELDPPAEYLRLYERQPSQTVMNELTELRIGPADGVPIQRVRNGNEITGEPFQSEQDRMVYANFGSLIDSLALDYGELFNGVFRNGIPLDDWNLDEMMPYFAA